MAQSPSRREELVREGGVGKGHGGGERKPKTEKPAERQHLHPRKIQRIQDVVLAHRYLQPCGRVQAHTSTKQRTSDLELGRRSQKHPEILALPPTR